MPAKDEKIRLDEEPLQWEDERLEDGVLEHECGVHKDVVTIDVEFEPSKPRPGSNIPY